ncbi:hypothetical protein NDU88_004152 [Pleurodeles waltl]|uniref:Uncharacterized protein n=1 Tax=Pleurodeles waltl TaxID=8319 RepID=A0AAV7UGC7_PLEWA|nr:hypothetical protein NDU88_004152 [Pleurodeles waltl]
MATDHTTGSRRTPFIARCSGTDTGAAPAGRFQHSECHHCGEGHAGLQDALELRGAPLLRKAEAGGSLKSPSLTEWSRWWGNDCDVSELLGPWQRQPSGERLPHRRYVPRTSTGTIGCCIGPDPLCHAAVQLQT